MELYNLNINNNLDKLKSKFPDGDDLKCGDEPRSKFHLKREDVHKIISTINSKSKGGNIGIDNELILWILDNDEQYSFSYTIWKLAKQICENDTDNVLRELLVYSKGLPLGKEKKGIKDADIRPVIIMDSIIRILDDYGK